MEQRTAVTKDAPPGVIERDIARTRSDLTETIDRIGEKFSAEHWKEVTRETIREKVETAAARGKELAGKARESARRFGQAAWGGSLRTRDRLLQFIKDDPAAASVIAFELGAWIVIISKSLTGGKRATEEAGGSEYAKAKIMSIEEVAQKVESAALAPEEGA